MEVGHVTNVENLNHENTPANGALLPILWLLAASCCLSVRVQGPKDLFYVSRTKSLVKGFFKSPVSSDSIA